MERSEALAFFSKMQEAPVLLCPTEVCQRIISRDARNPACLAVVSQGIENGKLYLQ